jgi:energy-coupling factor transporter ATP-binding protein EcfA2
MIKGLSLQNFAAFKSLELEFTSGINIIIGENSCGKTQLLKSIYALSSNKDITSNLLGLFKPHNGKLSGLYHQGGKGKAEVIIEDSSGQVAAAVFGPKMEAAKKESSIANAGQPVFLPTKEVLSLLPAIQSKVVTNDILASLFDDSIIDLCRILLSEPDSDLIEAVNNDPRLGHIVPMLVEAIGGKFEINGIDHAFIKGKFVKKANPNISTGKSAKAYGDFTQLEFKKEKSSETSVTMTAEGYRKIGLLQRLIDTGALVKGKTNVLLWDEPESNINPALMKLLVECLFELARNGQQVIIASHNYVMLKWFDLLMDKAQGDHVSYHALFRGENGDITKETTANYKMLSENAIAQTYNDLYDAELERSLGVAHE